MVRFFVVVSCLLLAVSLLGCSEKIENSYFYYGPGWTRLNKVAFITGLQSVRKDAIGTQLGSTYTETLTTMEADGTGLGLYLVRLIVERFGGRVWCESEAPRTRRFRFCSLPF